MNAILSLPASVRIVMFAFQMIVSAALLFCIAESSINRRSKLFVLHLCALFVAIVTAAVCHTPVTAEQNPVAAEWLSLTFAVPMGTSLVLFAKTKNPWFLLDFLWSAFNISFWSLVVPHYAEIVCALFLYAILRGVFLLSSCRAYSLKYPGKLAIKYALDGLLDGIAFSNKFGKITYINSSLKSVFEKLSISSYSRMNEIVKKLFSLGQTQGRIVSQKTVIVVADGRSYKFSFDKLAFQILCIDVTEEERLMRVAEQNKSLQQVANAELTENLKKIDEIQRQKELLLVKGHIHDNLAQKLSILHMYTLNNNLCDLTDLKKMLLSLEVLPESGKETSSLAQQKRILKSIGVDLQVEGKLPRQKTISDFAKKMIKEASTNAIRHGKASSIWAKIEDQTNVVRVSVSNDGTKPSDVVFGTGLSVLKKMAESLGGKLEISSGARFDVVATIPKTNLKTKQN